MTEQPITINPVEEAQFIHEYLLKEFNMDIDVDLIERIVDAQFEYMISVGIVTIDEEEE